MKTNPRRIPRSQADVDRAYQRGMEDATQGLLGIVVITLKDLGEPDDYIAKFEKKFNKTVQSLLNGDIKERDVSGALKEDYDIEVELQKEPPCGATHDGKDNR